MKNRNWQLLRKAGGRVTEQVVRAPTRSEARHAFKVLLGKDKPLNRIPAEMCVAEVLEAK